MDALVSGYFQKKSERRETTKMEKSRVSVCTITALFFISLILVVGAPNWRTIKEASAQLTTPTFTLVSNATTLDASKFIHITGTLSVSKTGTVTLYWTINGTGPYSHSEAITSGVFERDFGFSTGPGTWQLYVYWPGDATTNPATSNTITITVTPIPSPTPTPSPTPSPTPTSTATPSTPTPTPTLTPTPTSSSSPSVSPTPSSTFTPSPTGSSTPASTTPEPTVTPSPSPSQQDPSSSSASQIQASVWVPPPTNAAAATTVTVVAVAASSVAVAAAVTPVGVPTGKVTKEIRDLLPSSIKKWLNSYMSSKRKLSIGEKTGSPFVPNKSEAIAYCVSIAVLALSFSYVKANTLAEILVVLPTILATSVIVEFVKTFVLVVYARSRGVWTEHKLWYFGLATFVVTTFAFRVPFSSPTRSAHYAPKFTKRLDAILSSAAILITLAFAGLFFVLLISGFTMIGSTGFAMCIISAFFDTFPISPMKGKKIFDHSKMLWATLFITILLLYGTWLLLL